MNFRLVDSAIQLFNNWGQGDMFSRPPAPLTVPKHCKKEVWRKTVVLCVSVLLQLLTGKKCYSQLPITLTFWEVEKSLHCVALIKD